MELSLAVSGWEKKISVLGRELRLDGHVGLEDETSFLRSTCGCSRWSQQKAPKMKITTVLPSLLPAAMLLAPSASAQSSTSLFTFSFDFHGPSRSVADCGGTLMSEGDILTPCGTGAPAMPKVPGPLPTPRIYIPASGATGIGLPPVCIGTAPGVLCSPGIEVDALSYGRDTPVDQNIFVPGTNFLRKANYHFSVDEFAIGTPTTMFSPSVNDEAGVSDAAADVFVDVGFNIPPPFPPFAGGQPGNNGSADGDGRPQFPTYWAYAGTGLVEPTAPGVPPDLGDNLDAVDVDGIPSVGPFPVFYSLDSGFIDPRNGFPNSASAAALGFSGADVLASFAPGAAPVVYAPAGALGLDIAGGFGSDDLDALILWENQMNGFQPAQQAYDWINFPNNVDMLLFSVRVGSAVIGAPDSRFGLPIQPGDILAPPLPTFFGGVSPFPSIWIPAEDLGLEVSFARGGTQPFGDDIDALDHARDKQLLAHEYCFGDGGLAGCNNCPCGNTVPVGTQSGCRNSNSTGARLEVSGQACVTNDTLRFELTGATPNSFAVLLAGVNRLPVAGTCPPGSGIITPIFDGLRCIGGGIKRAGGRPTDINGDVGITNNGWGGTSGPAVGLLSFTGFNMPCLEVQWQVIYRDFPTLVCMTGLNTSQGVQVITLP